MRPFACFVLMSAALFGGDNDSIDSTVKSVYAAISGPAGPRDWGRFRGLFAEGARLIPVRDTGPMILTVDDYIARTSPVFEKSPFYESEVSRRVEEFGNIAHVFSTYESRRAPGERPFARGINSMQLVKSGNSWKVITILWDTERPSNPLPDKYLK